MPNDEMRLITNGVQLPLDMLRLCYLNLLIQNKTSINSFPMPYC